MKSITTAYALLIVFGGLLMVLGIIVHEDLAQHSLFLAFGTICLVSAGVLSPLFPGKFGS